MVSHCFHPVPEGGWCQQGHATKNSFFPQREHFFSIPMDGQLPSIGQLPTYLPTTTTYNMDNYLQLPNWWLIKINLGKCKWSLSTSCCWVGKPLSKSWLIGENDIKMMIIDDLDIGSFNYYITLFCQFWTPSQSVTLGWTPPPATGNASLPALKLFVAYHAC